MTLKKGKKGETAKEAKGSSKAKGAKPAEAKGQGPVKTRPSLDTTVNQLEGQYGKGVIQRSGQTQTISFVPTGILGLDALLGGGTPEGKILEIMGPESSGKTTMAILMAAAYQRKNEPVAMVDVEQAFHKGYSKDLGFDLDNSRLATFSQPDSAEEALDIAVAFAESGAVALSIVDSVAALSPKDEIEGNMEKSSYAVVAKLMGKACRKITGPANKNRNSVVFINQIRQKVGIVYGNPETTPGGFALKFFASIRLDIRKVGVIKEGDEVIGTEIKVKVVKNKTAPTAFSERTFKLYWGAGYDKIGDLIAVGSEYGTIRKSGAFFYNGDVKLGQGVTQAAANLAKDEVMLRDLLVKTVQVLIERRKLPEAYMSQIDFVLEGMKGGMQSPLMGFDKPGKKGAEESEENEEAAAS